MFRAMECLYHEQNSPSENLLHFVSDIDVYIFADRKMVDLAIQEDFEEYIINEKDSCDSGDV